MRLHGQASAVAALSRDIKLQDQVYEKARARVAAASCTGGMRSFGRRSPPCAVQELDKQSVDTNALLKLASTHVRAGLGLRMSSPRVD